MSQAASQLEQIQGEKPTLDELASTVGLELSQVHQVLQVSQPVESLQWPLDEEGEGTLEDLIEDENAPAPPDVTDYHLLQAKLEEALSRLNPREARILRLRFGLENGHSCTLKEVGQKFALTRERIRQIESQALEKLRQADCSGELREYLS